jgi:protein ImuA
VDSLQLHILKRRGPPLEKPLVLPAWSRRVSALLDARKGPAPKPAPAGAPAVVPVVPLHRRSHVLDRTAAIT